MTAHTPTVLITGASSGFGAACARRFAQDGARLILIARSRDKLQALAAELSDHCEIHTLSMDMQDKQAVMSLPAALPSAFQDIDILINNAGLALGVEPAHKADLDDWETMVDTNIKGLMRLSRAILPGMVERNRGHVINMGSSAASWPYPGGNAYGATKAFVQQFSRNLKADLISTAIRVSNIEPGMADTNFSKTRFKGDQASADKVYAGTQSMSAEDIAEAIHWCTRMPAHVNINNIELMPVCQAWNSWAVARES
ncbi:MAG: SDR family oxidoreductase [Oceanococcus sp.]